MKRTRINSIPRPVIPNSPASREPAAAAPPPAAAPHGSPKKSLVRTWPRPARRLIAQITTSFRALVEITVLRSLKWREMRHLRALLCFTGALLFFPSIFGPPTLRPGIPIFLRTLMLNVAAICLCNLMDGKDAGRWMAPGILLVPPGLPAVGGPE